MKTVTNITSKSLIVTLAFFALSLVSGLTNTVKAQTVTNTTTVSRTIIPDDTYCGVSSADIVRYLNARGYTVYKLEHISGSCDALATTQYTYRTRVIISNGMIIGHEDVPN
jgi:hypothetical protein